MPWCHCAIGAGAKEPRKWPMFYLRSTPDFHYRPRTLEIDPFLQLAYVQEVVVQNLARVPLNLSQTGSLSLSRRPASFGCDPKGKRLSWFTIYDLHSQRSSGRYQWLHYLNQAQSSTVNWPAGWPVYGTCFQCAAIDRAVLRTDLVTPRSDMFQNLQL